MDINFYNGTTCTADSMVEHLDAKNMWNECFPNTTEEDIEKMILNHATFMSMVKASRLDLRQFISNAILIWPNIFHAKNIKIIKNNVDKYVPTN
jgi:hypothetical protein